jgi:hypothetical protein
MVAERTADVHVLPMPLASFDALAADIEARFGPPLEFDLDSNGIGLFDATGLRFSCGLELGLSRFHLGRGLRTIDPAVEPSQYEVYANDLDAAHVAFHLGIPLAAMSRWPNAPTPVPVIVMRADDNGNQCEVCRVTSRCEAEAIAASYEARGHKQTYWVAD